jgi:TRAP-type C4-dicarboxylate transport system permease small subunit
METITEMSEATESFLDRLVTYSGYLSAALVFVLMLLITAGVIFRRVIQQPLVFGEEYSAYLMVFCVYIGGAYTLKHDAHIRVDVITIRLSEKWQTMLRAATSCIAIVYGAVLTWKTAELVVYYRQIGEQALSVLETPTWIPCSVIPVGTGILTVQMILCAIRDVRKCFK